MQSRAVPAILIVLSLLLLPHSANAADSETSIGRKFALVAKAELPVVRDYTVRRYVQRLGQRIVSHLDRATFSYQFVVVLEPHINAFSVPGGFVAVHSGLLQRAESDDEVASVLGHEVAHVEGHHMVRQQQDTKLLSYAGLAAMVLAVINPVLAAGASSLAGIGQLKYQRQLEEEADYRGLQYMRQADFNPFAMPRFFQKMQAEERRNGIDVPPYLLSHPMSKDRMSYIERILGTFNWHQTEPTDTFELAQVQAILRALQESRSRVIGEYERRVAAHPDDPQTQALLGVVLLQYHDWDRARQIFEEIGGKGMRLDRELGIAYRHLKQYARAQQVLRRQIETDPDNADAHNQLCATFVDQGNLDMAISECQAALQLDPYLDESYMTLAQIKSQQGKKGEALLFLARAMEERGRLEAALNQYQQVTANLPPNHPETEELATKVQELEEIISELRRMR